MDNCTANELQMVPEMKTEELCLSTLQHDGYVNHVPEEMKTKELCLAALLCGGQERDENGPKLDHDTELLSTSEMEDNLLANVLPKLEKQEILIQSLAAPPHMEKTIRNAVLMVGLQHCSKCQQEVSKFSKCTADGYVGRYHGDFI